MQRLSVVGAGGHAKVVISTARSAGYTDIIAVDDDGALWGRSILGVQIEGPSERVLADADALAVLAIGTNATRRALAARARCTFTSVVHASAVVDPTVKLEPGCVVFAGVVIQPDTTVGAHGIVNTGASIDHDCVLGEAVHVAPGARLAGAVTLGDEVFVGIGAAIIPGITVGARTMIGAGAAVVRDLAADVRVAGVPARVLARR